MPPPSWKPDIVYPESDGLPMADNSKQLRWIVTLYGNLEALYRDQPNVLVGGNLIWYPVKGMPEIRNAPDVFVVLGRPKGDRGSYQQWQEHNVPMTVVMEVLSPSNTHPEMVNKLTFHEDHGAEEYYVYDPDSNLLLIYVRQGELLRRMRPPHGFVSPKLGIRFDLSGPELVVYHPDGERFRTFEELQGDWELERNRRVTAEQQFRRLAELSRKARRGQASPEELTELQRLEEQGL